MTHTEIDETALTRLAEIFRALSDPTRVRLLWRMLDGPQNVGALAAYVGITEAGVSHHLRHLRLLHLVQARKSGREVFYTLSDEHVRDLLRFGLDHATES